MESRTHSGADRDASPNSATADSGAATPSRPRRARAPPRRRAPRRGSPPGPGRRTVRRSYRRVHQVLDERTHGEACGQGAHSVAPQATAQVRLHDTDASPQPLAASIIPGNDRRIDTRDYSGIASATDDPHPGPLLLSDVMQPRHHPKETSDAHDRTPRPAEPNPGLAAAAHPRRHPRHLGGSRPADGRAGLAGRAAARGRPRRALGVAACPDRGADRRSGLAVRPRRSASSCESRERCDGRS